MNPRQFILHHQLMGCIHIVLGGSILILGIAGVSLTSGAVNDFKPGTGIWCGIFLLTSGILQLWAANRVYQDCLLWSLLVLDSLSIVLVIAGLIVTGIELTARLQPVYPTGFIPDNSAAANIARSYSLAKTIIVLIVCAVGLVTLAAHLGFVGDELCRRGKSRIDRAHKRRYEPSAPPMELDIQRYSSPPPQLPRPQIQHKQGPKEPEKIVNTYPAYYPPSPLMYTYPTLRNYM